MASGRYRAHLVALLAWPLAAAQHVYVGVLEPTAAVIAWGSTGGAGNTIGFASAPLGDAKLRIAQRVLRTSERNWLRVENLTPDTDYPYEVLVGGSRLGGGVLRTWPQEADRLVFFVLGDWGTGEQPQHRLARAMGSEYSARRQQGDFVRFVLTTGDNVYADTFLGLPWRNSGNRRKGNIQRRLETAKIAGWAGQHQFLVVEVDRREVRITPRSWEPVTVRGPAGHRTVGWWFLPCQ